MRWPGSFIGMLLLTRLCFSQSYNFYFGNIHSHTGFSDGNKDSATSGVSAPDGSYAYAKLSQDFDFLGISEHNHYSSKGNPGFRRHLYQQGLDMADAANDEGSFLALYGIEYGVSSQYNGHVLIYGMNQLPGWEESVPGMTGPNYDVYNSKTDYKGLFEKVKATPGAFCYLAHPYFSDFSTDGTWATGLANAPYNADFDSVICGMPLRSGLATHKGDTYTNYPQGHYFNYYKKMLYNGYHLGIGYDHDNHYTNFGRGNGGRLVILANGLKRAEFYAAMRQRRFYGSDDSNAEISFTCNGAVMGSIISGNKLPTLEVKHHDPDGEQADSIKIWKGYRNSGELWAEVVHLVKGNNITIFEDSLLVPGREYFYFAEVRQKDEQWIVTSPVWYTLSGNVALSKESWPQWSAGYDAVNRELHLGASVTGRYRLLISDLQGRKLLERDFSGSSAILDVSAFPEGVYVVHVRNGNYELKKKLFVY